MLERKRVDLVAASARLATRLDPEREGQAIRLALAIQVVLVFVSAPAKREVTG
jgi:hypothetical protein